MKDKQPLQAVQVRVPSAVHSALKAEAQRQDRSLNWLAARILAEAVTSPAKEAVHAKS